MNSVDVDAVTRNLYGRPNSVTSNDTGPLGANTRGRAVVVSSFPWRTCCSWLYGAKSVLLESSAFERLPGRGVKVKTGRGRVSTVREKRRLAHARAAEKQDVYRRNHLSMLELVLHCQIYRSIST